MKGFQCLLGFILFGLSTEALSCEDGKYETVSGTNCRSYIECKNGLVSLKQCKVGQIFDIKTFLCKGLQDATCSDSSKVCEEGTAYLHPDSSSIYYKCEYGRISVKYCGAGEAFDPQSGTCIQIDKKYHFTTRNKRNIGDDCKEGTKHRDGQSCKDYIVCIKGVEMKKTCPDCMNYDEVTKSCRFNILLPCGPDSTMPTPPSTTSTTTEPTTAQPTEASTTQPTEPSTPQPTEPSTTQPTEPSTTQPTGQITGLPKISNMDEPETTIEQPSTEFTPEPVTFECSEAEKVSLEDPSCKKYRECIDGSWKDKTCSWGYKFDNVKLDCITSFWHKIDCNN